jgi:hypothetical protein
MNTRRGTETMPNSLTLDEAARRCGMSRVQVRESRAFTFIGSRVLEADVLRYEKQRQDAQRDEEDRAIQRPVNSAARIAAEEQWLAGIRGQGGQGLALDDKEAQLERDRGELVRYQAEATRMRIVRAGGEGYADALVEYDQWLKDMRAQGRTWRGQKEAERKVRAELAEFEQ